MSLARLNFALLLGVVLCTARGVVWAELGVLVVHVKDVQRRPVSGVQIGVEGDGGSSVTGDDGKARIRLAKQTKERSWVSLQILKPPPGTDFVVVSPWDYKTLVPSYQNESENFVEVVIVQRGDRAALESGTVLAAATARINKANTPKTVDAQTPPEDPKAALAVVAKQYGLGPDDLDQAIRAWGAQTTDPYEAGLAALYERNYPKATTQLQDSLRGRELKLDTDRNALTADERAVAEVAFFLGLSLSEQGRYRESVAAYQRCLQIQPDDPTALNNTGLNLIEAGDYAAAEPLLRKALSIREPSPCSFSASAAGNNGNVYQIVNNRDNTRNENFMYDSLNRIQQAYSSGSGAFSWGETFGPFATSPGVPPSTQGIDSWGNLTNRSGVTGKTYYEPLNCPANTNNQLTTCSSGYDAAGNMTSNGSVSYVYDAESRLVWTNALPGNPQTRYIYDGNGQRVEKCAAASATTTCPTSGTTGTLYWRGTGSDTLAETDLGGNYQEEYIFFNGQRIARRDTTSTGTTIAVHYYFSDHLGSHTVVENAGGKSCDQDIDYYPYGGVEHDYCPNVAQNYKFTGKERDAESGLDYFGARHYSSAIGRFMVPDPAGILVQDPSAPQSWNLYSYVLNNPLGAVDPNGLDCVYASASDVPGGDTSQLIPGANGTFIKTGDCISDTDNGFYFDGTVDPNSVGFNPNGDVVANVNDNTGCSGDCPDSLISATASDQENDVIWGIGGGQGALVLQTAGLEATHGLNCAGYGFLTSGGTALFKLGQPVVGSKPFITPGSSKGTSPLSEALRDALPGKLPFGARVPTLVGGMGTGTPLRIKPQAKVGAALGRAAPFLGAAVTAYSAYKFSQCLSEVPK